MKLLKTKKFTGFAVVLAVLAFTLLQACQDNTITSGNYNEPLSLTGVRFASPDSTGKIERIGPGDAVALRGKNMTSVVHVFFNGYEAAFNPNFATDSILVVTIPSDMPLGDMDPNGEEMNTIKVTNNNSEAMMEFTVGPPPPKINSVSNEFAEPGQRITITGQFLYLITDVIFPGGVVAEDYEFAGDGSWLKVTVPTGVTEAGHITVTNTSGSSKPTYSNTFNDKSNIFINFDDKNPFAPWGPTPVVTNSYQNIQSIDGNYMHWDLSDIPGTLWWCQELATPLEGIDWSAVDIPANTDLAELAFKMEVNIPEGLNSGHIQFQVNWTYNYEWHPWMELSTDSEGKITVEKRDTYKTDGWQTVIIPMSVFKDLGASTLADIEVNWYITFINHGSTGVPIEHLDIGYDNFRIVEMN